MTHLSLKRFLLVLTVVSLTIVTTNAQKYKKYYQKSGKMEQKLSGNSKGTCITYWDDYGYKEVKIEKTVTKVFGIKNETNKTSLMIGSTMYEWEENSETMTKVTIDMAKTWEDGNYTADQVAQSSIATMRSLGYEKKGTETILGKTCDVWEGIGKSWAWKNLSLKAVVKVMGMEIAYEPVSLELDYNVPANLFEIPSGKKIVEANVPAPGNGNDEDDGETVNPKKVLKSLFGNNDDD